MPFALTSEERDARMENACGGFAVVSVRGVDRFDNYRFEVCPCVLSSPHFTFQFLVPREGLVMRQIVPESE